MIQIMLNGAARQVPQGTTLASLLAELNLSPDKVAVEWNRKLVRSGQYDQPLQSGDQIEVVTFVGGG
jgi:thiamine biosynthesis protein ThiS